MMVHVPNLTVDSRHFKVIFSRKHTLEFPDPELSKFSLGSIRDSVTYNLHQLATVHSRIIKQFSLEKTFEIIKAKSQPDLGSPITKPCPLLPHQCIS